MSIRIAFQDLLRYVKDSGPTTNNIALSCATSYAEQDIRRYMVSNFCKKCGVYHDDLSPNGPLETCQ